MENISKKGRDSINSDFSPVKSEKHEDTEDEWYEELEAELKAKSKPQDLVRVGDKTYVRMDLGISASVAELEELGLTFEEVERYRYSKHQELDGKIRALANCEPEPDGEWGYSYKLEEGAEPGTTVCIMGAESVSFKSREIFRQNLVFGLVE